MLTGVVLIALPVPGREEKNESEDPGSTKQDPNRNTSVSVRLGREYQDCQEREE